MSEDGIYKRLESLLSGSEALTPDPVPPSGPVEALVPPVEALVPPVEAQVPPAAPPHFEKTPEPVRTLEQEAPIISTMIRPRSATAPAYSTRQEQAPTTRARSRIFDPREWALSTQLAVIITLLVASSIAAATLITTRTVRTSLTNQVGNDFIVEAQGQIDQIKRYFLEKGGQLQTLSLSETLVAALEERNASYSGTNEQVLSEIEQFDTVWQTSGRGDTFILTIISQIDSVNLAAHELHNFSRAFPDHVELILTDRYGATVATNRLLSNYYQGDQAWWQAAWNNGGGAVYLTDPEFNDSANVTASLLAIPVRNNDGEVIGVLRTTLVLEELYTRLTPTTAGSSRHTVLFDNRGEVLFDPRAEDLNSAGLPEEDRRQFSSLGVHFGIHTDQFGTDFILGTSQLDKPSTLDSFPNQQTQALADSVSDLGWAVVVRQSTRDAFAGVNTVALNITLVGLISVVVSTIVGILVARAINRPLIALSESAARLGTGDLDVDLSAVRGSSEIRQVNRTFETMAGRLKELLTGLEARVTERTRDLELSAEVGSNISRLRNLDQLLNESVERIRIRFSLYYTQIYLADPSARRLTLRAGTGKAGEALLGRKHQLQISLASINGRAAAERRPVIVSNTATSPNFLPNPLLPETRSEMAVPLVSGDRLLGVLDMQSVVPGGFSSENLPAFEALAGQLAVAIENANLFQEAEQARRQIESQIRQSSQKNWGTYLDAIEHEEKLGYQFEGETIRSWDGITQKKSDSGLRYPLRVVGANIGTLSIEDENERAWSLEESEIAQRVSEQLSAHIENLRLLSEAERFRGQAEAAVRRQTADGWDGYLGTGTSQEFRYSYDGVQVTPSMESNGKKATLEQALAVLGVPIGELSLWMDEASGMDEEALSLVQAVSDRLASHVENLRLSDQSSRLLAELEENVARLEDLDLLKSSFLANMSHELRTPLNSILGFTQVMQEGVDGPLSEQMEADLAVIRRNGSHLLHLIDDVLDMAKIEAGRMTLEPESIELGTVLDEILEITAPLADQKGLNMSVGDPSSKKIRLVVDPVRFRQVMLNVIGNAIKFTEKGEIVIRAELDGDMVRICVRDTGIGIPKENHDLIFEAFGQVDTSTTRKAGGTGLGLPISRHLVSLHHGRIWVESKGVPGDGSSFYVELPAEFVHANGKTEHPENTWLPGKVD